jgi:hypothetical protein
MPALRRRTWLSGWKKLMRLPTQNRPAESNAEQQPVGESTFRRLSGEIFCSTSRRSRFLANFRLTHHPLPILTDL